MKAARIMRAFFVGCLLPRGTRGEDNCTLALQFKGLSYAGIRRNLLAGILGAADPFTL
jgi:hypothetical protein